MFRIRLLWVGKTRESYLREGIQLYERRLKPYVNLRSEEIRAARTHSGEVQQCRIQETRDLLKRLDNPETSVFLDEQGETLGSREFAVWLQSLLPLGISRLTFIIGGAHGLERSMIPSGAKTMRLSAMTFNHQMVRLVFLEQLYRAFTIIHGEPYHH